MIIVSKDDIDKFEEHEIKKIRPIKKNLYDWLIKQTMARKKKPKIIRDKLKDKIVRGIWTHLEIQERKEERREKKHNEIIIKDRIMRYIRTLFEQKEDYYEPKWVSNFSNNTYIEYESNGDKNRNLSLDKYLNKIKLYVRNTIIDLENSDAWKIQLTTAINLSFQKMVKKSV